ncbi:MAG: outer membrane beta-barrel protein [Spirochaetota bacterium]|nr:outer membrane beta-barrel protein [Spirochaetota bacterium]
MLKKVILYIFSFVLLFTSIGNAKDVFGIGIYMGAQHDVGNLNSYNPYIQIDPQNNLLLGFACKVNYLYFFGKTGVETTFLINRGEVEENSDEIEYVKIDYTSIPIFAGMSFPILSSAEFYMGGGFAYFLGRGEIKSSSSFYEDEIDTTAFGIGFILGISYIFPSSIRCYFEWKYLDGRSDQISQTQSSYNWQNYYVDFTGHRIFIGIMYYLI